MKKKIIIVLFICLCLFINMHSVMASSIYFLDTVDFYTCENPNILRVVFYGKLLLNIVKIVVPIGMIVMGMIDYSKSVSLNDEGAQKKNLLLFGKRVLMGVLVFIVPWIVETIIVGLGDLTDGVNFTDCIQNANEDRIKVLQDKYDAWLETQKNSGNSSSGNGSSSNSDIIFSDEVKVKIKYDDAIVDNLAAFIGSEANAYPEGFEAQLITGAVFMNNMYFSCGRKPFVTSPEQITKETMCNTFSYGGMYRKEKCDYTLDSLGFNDAQKKRLIVSAKLLLSGIFTIPSNINCQGILPNWQNSKGEQIGIEWGSLAVRNGCTIDKYHEDSCSQTYAYSKYCTVAGGISNKDIYGNTVSTNFDDYKSIADTLYKKYVVEGKEIF